jgi:hypothetical protein
LHANLHQAHEATAAKQLIIDPNVGVPVSIRNVGLLVACSILGSTAHVVSQELTSPDSELTIEQWHQRVEDARRRSDEFVATAHTRRASPLSSNEGAEDTDQRAMSDLSLERGDIIATSKGFVVFVGREGEEHEPSDFLPTSKPRYPPEQLSGAAR